MAVTIAAHAKINLTLSVTGRRADGYHDLHTVMQSLALADTVTVALCENSGIYVACSDEALQGHNNLAYAAAQAYLNQFDRRDAGVVIRVEKHIPVAAGLGGGSADAAAVLLGLNHLYGQPCSNHTLLSLAAALGADVPFCLTGGTALAQGMGERLQPLAPLPECYVVLAKPCEKESTAAMYQKFDARKGLSDSPDCDIIGRLSQGDLCAAASCLHNDFLSLWEQQAVFDTLSLLSRHGALGASLTGSGPTVFGLFAQEPAARAAANAILPRTPACVVTGLSATGCSIISC